MPWVHSTQASSKRKGYHVQDHFRDGTHITGHDDKDFKHPAAGGAFECLSGMRGISGGFALERNTEEITLLDIVDATEGVDIRGTLDVKTREHEKELYVHCQQVSGLIGEELARHTVYELFSHDEADCKKTGKGRRNRTLQYRSDQSNAELKRNTGRKT